MVMRTKSVVTERGKHEREKRPVLVESDVKMRTKKVSSLKVSQWFRSAELVRAASAVGRNLETCLRVIVHSGYQLELTVDVLCRYPQCKEKAAANFLQLIRNNYCIVGWLKTSETCLLSFDRRVRIPKLVAGVNTRLQ